ncbi:hypothetical protein D910_11457 [Dendroctonus ponderosae]
MSNKKHQREPTGAGLSSDSEDENQTNAECSHINKAVDLTSVKKIVNKHGFLAECSECKRLPVDPELAELEMELDLTLWLCLKCGHQACGRGNTCFFNSVMQCLGQTPYLVTLLDDTASAGQLFQLPGGTLKMKGKDNVLLPPLEGNTIYYETKIN